MRHNFSEMPGDLTPELIAQRHAQQFETTISAVEKHRAEEEARAKELSGQAAPSPEPDPQSDKDRRAALAARYAVQVFQPLSPDVPRLPRDVLRVEEKYY